MITDCMEGDGRKEKMKTKAKEKAYKHFKDMYGKQPEHKSAREAIDIAIKQREKEMLEKIEKVYKNGWANIPEIELYKEELKKNWRVRNEMQRMWSGVA